MGVLDDAEYVNWMKFDSIQEEFLCGDLYDSSGRGIAVVELGELIRRIRRFLI